MKRPSILFICLVFVLPVFGESSESLTTTVQSGCPNFITPVNLVLTAPGQATALEGTTVDFLKGIKMIVLLSYVGLVTLIVTLSLKRRKMIEHFHQLKRQHVTLCHELEEKIILCSNLSTQTNQRARELTSSTLSIIQKHNVLTLVKNELKALSPVFTEAPLTDTTIGKKFKSVNDFNASDNCNYWDDFLMHFRILYPNYLTNVKMNGNDITEKELKLAALLRLGLDTKKIAALLNLSPVSIKVFRHRLRKKLELPEDVNLYNYLSHFDNLGKINS
jgi:DNA-binding CsgD family transcriptional regulator